MVVLALGTLLLPANVHIPVGRVPSTSRLIRWCVSNACSRSTARRGLRGPHVFVVPNVRVDLTQAACWDSSMQRGRAWSAQLIYKALSNQLAVQMLELLCNSLDTCWI